MTTWNEGRLSTVVEERSSNREQGYSRLPWNEWNKKKEVDWDRGKTNQVLSVWELCENVQAGTSSKHCRRWREITCGVLLGFWSSLQLLFLRDLKNLENLREGIYLEGKEEDIPFARWEDTLSTKTKKLSQGICMYLRAACQEKF